MRMEAAIMEGQRLATSLNIGRLRDIVLLRIAATAGATRSELGRELASLSSHRLSLVEWRRVLDQTLAALKTRGMVIARSERFEATDAGRTTAVAVLGCKGALLPDWEQARNVQLIAKVLGLENEPHRRLMALAKADGLRAAVVQLAFKIKIKGSPTPSRLRQALAVIALERAFGNRIKARLSKKTGLSARAARLLAGQLSQRRRDFGTDSRLIAGLAAEQLGVAQADLDVLQLALLRRYLESGFQARVEQSPDAVGACAPAVASRHHAKSARADLASFAREVLTKASAHAEGWPGNRRAYISHVWRSIREARPEWGLSEIEFKCMLAEAHRVGQLVLAHADLKDNNNIKDVQESAIAYKNAVFHFIRVDA
jgi:hypothetical protein